MILGDATGLGEDIVPSLRLGTDLDLAGGEVERSILEALTPRADEGAFVGLTSCGLDSGS